MTAFGHFSRSEIFITIDLYLKPGLYICISTYPIAVLCKHQALKDFLVPFPPSSVHSASLPSTPVPGFYIFILDSSFCFVLSWSAYRTCPIHKVSAYFAFYWLFTFCTYVYPFVDFFLVFV